MYLKIRLLSDTAFGRGNGAAGMVDSEVEHDSNTGLPIIKGRTIKGLMVEACADLLYGLETSKSAVYDAFVETARELFGSPGSDMKTSGILRFHTATLPQDFVDQLKHHNWKQIAAQKRAYEPAEILSALTDVRHQTAVDATTDRPQDHSLRTTRVVIRQTIFHAKLTSNGHLMPYHNGLLAACANTVRHAGLNRTRGLGHVEVTFIANDDPNPLAQFESIVSGRL